MTFFSDLRYAIRMLTKSPALTATAVATLALGIGANAAIFSLLDAVVLRPLPYRQPDRVVALWEVAEDPGGQLYRASPASFLRWRERSRSFENVSAFGAAALTLASRTEPESLRGVWSSPEYFRVLGVTPVLGRVFTLQEARERAKVVVLSHELWRTRFGGDPSILGRALTLDGTPYAVIGILPPGIYPSWPSTMAQLSFAPDNQQFWIPREVGVGGPPAAYSHVLGVLGRLRSGISVAAAEADLRAIARALRADDPNSSSTGVRVRPISDEAIGNVRPALVLFGGAVGFVLLIACVNVASVQLARAERRRREVAIRSALGGGRGRILRQLLVENLALAAAGGAAGVLTALWALPVAARQMPAAIPRLSDARVDVRTVVIAAVLSCVAALILGAVSGLHLTRGDPIGALRAGAASGGVRERRSLRALVALEIGLAVLLVTGAGLFARSLGKLERVDAGFRPEHVVIAGVIPPRIDSRDPQRLARFQANLLERVRALPGVSRAGLAYNHPLEAQWNADAELEGADRGADALPPTVWFRAITDGYFDSVGVPLLAGRDFAATDDAAHPPVALVNESFVRRYARGESPVGRILRSGAAAYWWGKSFPVRWEIVGVVKDVRFLGLTKEPEPAFYLSARQFPIPEMKLVVRGSVAAPVLIPKLRARIRELDPTQPVGTITTLTSLYDQAIGQQRFNTRVMVLFGGTALVLAMLGIYGLLSFIVTGRRREIGIRIALGARTRQVVGVVLREVAGLALGACLAGLLAARILAPGLKRLLFGISVGDPAAWIAAPSALFAIAVAAAYLPARRASRIDPAAILRSE